MIDNKDDLKPKEIKKNNAKEPNKTLESLKKQAAELKEEAKKSFDIAKGKINENLSDENIEKAKEVFNDASKKASDFAESPKEEIEEAAKKTKTFFQKLFRK